MLGIPDEMENLKEICPQCQIWPLVDYFERDWQGTLQFMCRHCELVFARYGKLWMGTPLLAKPRKSVQTD